MGKKIWLSMHPRNFASEKIVGTYVRPFLLAYVKSRTYEHRMKAYTNCV